MYVYIYMYVCFSLNPETSTSRNQCVANLHEEGVPQVGLQLRGLLRIYSPGGHEMSSESFYGTDVSQKDPLITSKVPLQEPLEYPRADF